jgi:hypothetical protein
MKRVFWFHYNKPLSRKLGKPMMTIHFAGACHSVEGIVCNVKTWTHIRKTQPHIVIKGVGVVEISEGKAIIK